MLSRFLVKLAYHNFTRYGYAYRLYLERAFFEVGKALAELRNELRPTVGDRIIIVVRSFALKFR
ncbi:hypothetical protein FNW02_00645 [Komarekiella sp. 'clone 1']|uniref:Uncharacterized protein n=1 Tax=Komarekiella delphini-convector SJRDD-AB1 TaxID=2593771 RepID=A0AA40SSG3_9NOST|nr:hypothetical protein [Komarekiella delphini-convector SJRDD-AB1]